MRTIKLTEMKNEISDSIKLIAICNPNSEKELIQLDKLLTKLDLKGIKIEITSIEVIVS